MTDDVQHAVGEPGIPEGPNLSSLPRDLGEALLIALMVATFVRTFLFQVVTLDDRGMEPNLLVGDRVLINRMIYALGDSLPLLPGREPERGDVAFYEPSGGQLSPTLRRCMGLPGETVDIRAKTLHIDDQARSEHYVLHTDPNTYVDSEFLEDALRQRDHYGPRALGPGEHIMLADLRDVAQDSRFRGPVTRQRIKGRAVRVLWSAGVSAQEGAHNQDSDQAWGTIETPESSAAPERVRWDRLWHPVL